ncbi:permease [Lentilactobacillus sp. Marseille-Q4993]|uniref:ABC transporter permease n=1 Tax=Lentilactobacillus sp. Marseille-Q4993 TaxID=3039492 RepID=UPI0024BD2ACF|nr:permease [Lentilactobacillus sp. Marseille-Q4993]
MTNLFAKTGFLARFYFKKDRNKLIIWAVVLLMLMVSIAYKFGDLYGSQKQIQAIMPTLRSKSMVSLFGTLGYPASLHIQTANVFAQEMVIFMAIITVIMNFGLAVSGSRGQEDNGVIEMIRAKMVGKIAPLAASAIEIIIINLILGVLYGAGIQAANMAESDTNGDWLLGLSMAAVGIMFGVFGLLMAQIADHSNNAMILSYFGFAIAYVVRMATDVTNPDYTWWSPIGWLEKTSPYHGNNWLPVVWMIVLTIILLGLTFYLNLHRDLGSGIISSRPGRQRASATLMGPVTLLMRLERTTIIAWILGSLMLGASYGSIYNSIGDILKTNPTMQQVFGKAAVDSANQGLVLNFSATIAIVIAVVATIPAIQIMLKLKSDESKGWLELINSKPVSRIKMVCSYSAVAMVTGIITWLVGIGTLFLVGNSTLKSSQQIDGAKILATIWTYIPAILVMMAIAMLIIGWLPRFASFVWLYTAAGFVIMYMGGLLKLPDWTKNVIPFGWVNKVPVKNIDWSVFTWMLVLFVGLMIIGWIGYRKRDFQTD